MAKVNSVWGIDIGQCALKALKLTNREGELTIDAVDIIEHPTVLSHSEGREHELIRAALETFAARNKLAGCSVAITVPGQSSFTRFVKLPPVETKRIPDIVKFEAEQQIPFPMDEVLWRWQTFQDPDSPDVEVGIFAMKRVDIEQILAYFNETEIPADIVQTVPLALFNFMTFDKQVAPEGATLLMDVGTAKTDLVIADGPRLWTRTIQIGGSNFTEALVKAFKLSFDKAQKLKRSAATSKYARQIFQSMRPVFSDLVQEVQRSIGYYTSLHRETRFKRLVGLGNGFRLPGLQRFLEQNLNVPVVRVDGFNAALPAPGVSVPMLTENVLSFAPAYGAALQGVAAVPIRTNLLPQEIARKRLWSKKRPWFAAAAAMIIAALVFPLYRSYADLSALSPNESFDRAKSITDRIEKLRIEDAAIDKKIREASNDVDKYFNLYSYRQFWPRVEELISRATVAGGAATDQVLLRDYVGNAQIVDREKMDLGADPKGLEKELKKALDISDFQKSLDAVKALPESDARVARVRRAMESMAAFRKIPRAKRRVMVVSEITPAYVANTTSGPGSPARSTGRPAASPPAAAAPAAAPVNIPRGFAIKIVAWTPLDRNASIEMLSAFRRAIENLLKEKSYSSIALDNLTWDFQAARGDAKITDPLLGEASNLDTDFTLTLVLAVAADGLEDVRPAPAPASAAQKK
ncbi:MAG: type IV pilus assembly protein PilM [Planctomycetaceae bacterium]|nr:type IV pilus assembly protein PilM [Planctomycetaceae bacterium]